MKRLTVLFTFLMTLSFGAAMAQDMDQTYGTALGLKIWGGSAGISAKRLYANNRALEGVLYFFRGGTRITGLYEFHFDIANAPGLRWYVGPGAHIGFYNGDYYNSAYFNTGSGAYVGIDGVLGLDYKFNGAPINLSIDWQPSFEFGADRGFLGNWGGLGIRYTF